MSKNSKIIAVIQNAKGKFLGTVDCTHDRPACAGRPAWDYIWTANIAKADKFSVGTEKKPLDFFANFEHERLIKKGIGKAKVVKYVETTTYTKVK